MTRVFLVILCNIYLSSFGQSFTTRFEQSNGNETGTYQETIKWWKSLDAASSITQMKEMGTTDSGYPLHLVLISADKDFDIKSIKSKQKTVILINNGIHPGEPDGIDACMVLSRDIVQNKFKLPSNVVLAIIPIYNIGGALNRGKNYRVDQNGPLEKGFRGNGQNLDLNRDFIKMDSKNAFAFAKIFHHLDPDVFIDNHVSNGADYQHVMTLLSTQHNKLGGEMGEFLSSKFEPEIYRLMKTKGWDLVPYVNHFGETPDKGWSEFWDSPRYSSGYGTLWNSFSFVPETHMLKLYKQRVESTLDLMKSFIAFSSAHAKEIIDLRNDTKKKLLTQEQFPLAWKWDSTKHQQIIFKGYEATHKPSEVTSGQRLYYDRSKPFEKKVPFYNTYNDTFSVQKPKAYIIPQGWWKIIERLQANNVQMQRIVRDTSINVEGYRIENYQSLARPFEGHHLNQKVQVSKKQMRLAFRSGDYYIPLNQPANRFLIEILEPQGEDSYFAWNFFDAILQQKEGFSDYVFEETAAAFLKRNPDVKKALDQKRATDSVFAKNAEAQLNFIYQHSPYYDPSHLQYPVYRVLP